MSGPAPQRPSAPLAARLPWDPADPYGFYEQRRRVGEVVWDDGAGAWLVLGYYTARRLLTSKGWSSDPLTAPGARERANPLGSEFIRGTMLFADGAQHRRLRGALRDVFTPPAIAGLADGVHSIVDQLVDSVEVGAPVDLAADIALPMPHAVISAWMDLDAETALLLGEHAPAIIRALGAFADSADFAAGAEAAALLTACFLPLAADRRAHPGGDLLSFLATDTTLALDEVVANALVVAVAGHETTANALGSGLVRLLADPELLAAVDPHHPGLVSELLRLDAPTQAVARIATRDQEVAGVRIAEGEQALVILAAANRDPEMFEEPERVRPERDRATLLSFGHGPHVCLGMALAKLELEYALPRILARRPVTTGPALWRDIPAIRGPLSVPAMFTR